MSGPSRRTVLTSLAVFGAIGVGGGALGKVAPDAAAHQEDVTAWNSVRIERGVLRSRYRRRYDSAWLLVRPKQPRGLVVALHGKGGQSWDWVLRHDIVAAAGESCVAVAAIDGGDTWWHPRTGGREPGTDSGSLVFDELLPLIARHGIDTRRMGLLGLSMGGFGALSLAQRHGPTRCAAVATLSAAVYRNLEDSDPEAFDGPADFAAHDVITHAHRLRDIPVWMTVGTSDAFVAGNRALAGRLPQALTDFRPGGHNDQFWVGQARTAVRFLAPYL
ncbi:alpha/beta hydrolase [Austwickia chelonae]|uniref:alpha/beta hydrolase n=1 Tax=Austwickia chelonae TaxID=100225 RepID=UPI000E235089|nr:alpha/beta hydrolase-fold protein [Austwickia chelonae]